MQINAFHKGVLFWRALLKILLIMKLIMVIMIAFLVQVKANVLAQRISLSEKNTSLQKVIDNIHKQSGYDFLVLDYKLVSRANPVTIQVENENLKEVLDRILLPRGLDYILEDKSIVIKGKVSDAETTYPMMKSYDEIQQQKVRGRVVNEKGEPLSGATIYVLDTKGNRTSLKAKTDANGNFEFFQIVKGTELEVTFLGYSPQKLLTYSEMKIILSSSLTNIEMVDVNVSTGYQSIPKERSTGSFSWIGKNKLDEQVSTDILSKLDGTVNGLVFDRGTSSTPRISIRGLSTLQSSMNTPLIVLDNFPYDGDINNINPNDVDNITVLKDAAAASIWGAKAANGVIVISTKKGKLNQPLKIDVSANTTLITKPDLFSLQRISSSDFIDVEQILYSKGYYKNDINSASKPVLSPVVELLIQRENANPEKMAGIDKQIESYRAHDVRNDFDKYVYKNGINQQYALSMNGGSELIGWNAFVGSDINSDNLGNKYNRINARFQNTIAIAEKLKLSSNVTFNKSSNIAGRQGIDEIGSKGGFLYPYARLADDQGNALPVAKNWRLPYIDTLGNGKLLDWKYYPLNDYKSLDQKQEISDFIGSAGLTYSFLKWIHADVLYQYERQTTSYRKLQDENSYFTRDMINQFTQFDLQGNAVRKIPEGGIVDYSDDVMTSHNWRGQLSIDKKTGDHNISGIIGVEVRQSSSSGHTSRSYGFDGNTLTSGLLDYSNSYPHLITGVRLFIDNGISANERVARFISTYANMAYTFKDKYIFSASARRDASNLFGFKTNDRWNPLWSSGLGWKVSEEPFYKNSNFGRMVPFLKTRVTYGKSGNIHPSLAAATTIKYRGNSSYTQSPYASFDKYANPELRWETTAMFNLGIDFGTKGNRLNGSIEYYNKKSKDLFANVPIDYTGGIGPYVVKNAAEMSGWGWDIQLNSLNIDGKFKWKSEINLSINHDEITKYYLASERGSIFMQAIPTLTGLKGKPAYSILSYRWAGLDPETGAPRGYVDGEISSKYTDITGAKTTINDLVYHGAASPTVFGSVGNTFLWKGFSATVRIQYKLNYFFRKQTISYSALYANWDGNSDYAKRWVKPGDENITDVPSFTYPASSQAEAFYKFAEPFVLRADHIRLQYVNLAYQFNKINSKTFPVKSFKVFFLANNLGLLWKKNELGLDPDYSYNKSMLEPSKTFTLGIQATF